MIQIHVAGVPKVTEQLRAIGPTAKARVKAAIQDEAIKVLRLAKEKVSGPVLKNRTGTLRRKINQRVMDAGNSITASVGLSLAYAAAHEYGFEGTVNVKEHLRMMKVAFGRPVKDPHQITVHAHPMKMNLPERSFLRSSLAECEPSIVAALRAATGSL
jgi:phage gpG-like protein